MGAGVALGVGLLGWFLAGLHWSELAGVLSEVSLLWVGIAVVVMLGDYALQAVRWGILLEHAYPDVRFSLLWSATALGWAFNTMLPLRAGNFLRPAVVALRRDVPYTTLLFTTVAEYVCDIFGVLAMFAAMLLLLPVDTASTGLLGELKALGPWLVAGGLVSFFTVLLLGTRQARSVVERALVPVPSSRVRRQILRLFDQLVAGIAAVGHPGRLAQALVVTLAIWGLWLVAILATLRAFGIEMPLSGALFMEAALCLSMLVPQAPGFLGVFHVVTEEALTLWGTPVAQAEGIALVFWSVCFVPVTLWGIAEGWRQGLSLRSGRTQVFDALAREVEGASEREPDATG